MGLSHRIYKLKGNHSLEDAEIVIKKIYAKLVEGTGISYWFNLGVGDISKYQLIESSYPSFKRNEYFFSIKIPNAKAYNKLLNQDGVYNRFNIYSHKEQRGDFIPFLGYSLVFNREMEEIKLLINLTYTDIEKSKTQMINAINHLVNSEVFFIIEPEIELIANTIIDLNSSNYAGGWSYKDRIEVAASPNITPKGEKTARPSSVQFRFDKKFLNRWWQGDINSKTRQINESMSEFITEVDYFKGLIYTKDLSNFQIALSKIPEINLTTNIGIDLSKHKDYSTKQICQFTEGTTGKELLLENFNWKKAKSTRRDGSVSLNFEDNDFELEIMVNKNIEESYKDVIENTIDYELVHSGWL